jgi:class 3 adenylate cyclase/tetratricopeptide (TPR) repeat protein
MLPRVRICPSCGRENAEDARFCSACGAQLAGELTTREERKVVTCLFCDLVGFTARAERMDPEDVRRLLQPYHARVRVELERFGGTVEKFIGDAVMAVFGAPIAHEDDPERAVRAALAIREALAEEGDLEVRIGITTGEALITLDARPDAGEGMASGDVVNTAARLQAAAPTGAILVDETTYRATERAIELDEANAIEAKGKSAPVPVWTAVRARARVAVERVGGGALVGRAQELALLRETQGRVVRERRPQLVTIVGVPGIGKSRLVFELFQTIQTGAFGLVYWRNGRSLPYGEGVTFWALGEIVKAQAGILESDSSEQASEKLSHAVERFVTDAADAAWIERHLRPLAGLERNDDVEVRRDEAFAAWRRFLEAIADDRPLVLVFEDLHWADEALLDFIDHLVDWADGVALLVLCTTRPELLTRRGGWGGGKVNSSTILLSPLSEEETAALVHELLGRAAIDAGLQARLLEHAGGNPLYAEEFTRMHLERPTAAVVPESVQGMIAARLDTLAPEEKELLQDAAVIGRVFWLGALDGERWTLEERLHVLARKEFVSRERRSIVAGEVEYAFRHALVRDVAYEQIPRAQRADKHRRTAEWIESLGRVEDHAEMLAHHYGSALEYARTTGANADVFAEPAREAFEEAGDRAFALHAVRQAAHFFERALDLWDTAPPELLLRYGRTLAVSDDERGTAVLEEALGVLLATGNREAAAEAHAFLTEALQLQGRRDAAYDHSERALELVRDAPPSPAKARVLTESSRLLALDERQLAFQVAQDAYEMALDLGLIELAARAMCNLGLAKTQVMDFDGAVDDLERSRELAQSVGSPEEARALHNLGSATFFRGNPGRASELFGEAAHLGRRFGALQMTLASTAVHCSSLCTTGAWDESLRIAEELIARLERGGASYFEYHLRYARSRIGLARAVAAELVLADARRAVEVGRSAKDRQAVIPMLSNLAYVAAELGELDEAEDARRELLPLLAGASPINVHRTIEIAYVADSLHCVDELRHLARTAPEGYTWRDVVLAVLDLDFVRVAAMHASLGHVDEGYARLRAGQRHLADGHRSEAETELQACIAFHRPLGATRWVRDAQELLTGAGLQVSA